mmetsp:Transcript_16764/g.54816  ORF Transcript_16764/g.54816 Transcript_16764/m.54816 type:complete len:244 (-) Transcript_16764:10-741(-)
MRARVPPLRPAPVLRPRARLPREHRFLKLNLERAAELAESPFRVCPQILRQNHRRSLAAATTTTTTTRTPQLRKKRRQVREASLLERGRDHLRKAAHNIGRVPHEQDVLCARDELRPSRSRTPLQPDALLRHVLRVQNRRSARGEETPNHALPVVVLTRENLFPVRPCRPRLLQKVRVQRFVEHLRVRALREAVHEARAEAARAAPHVDAQPRLLLHRRPSSRALTVQPCHPPLDACLSQRDL